MSEIQCHRCGKGFTKVEHLKRHERSHVGDRPFQCEVCSKFYGRKDVLKRHKRQHESATSHMHSPSPSSPNEHNANTPAPLPYTEPSPTSSFERPSGQIGESRSNLPQSQHAPLGTLSTTELLETMGNSRSFAISMEDNFLSGNGHPAELINASADMDNSELFTLDYTFSPIFGHDLLSSLSTSAAHLQMSSLDPFSSANNPFGPFAQGFANEETVAIPLPNARIETLSVSKSVELDEIAEIWPTIHSHHLRIETQTSTSSSLKRGDWDSVTNELGARVILEPIKTPSSTHLSAYLRCYLHRNCPGKMSLHRPTLIPHNRPPLLLLAMCATGAELTQSSAAKSFSEQVFERIDTTLQHIWKNNLETENFLDLLHVAIMLQSYRTVSGVPSKIASALATHGGIVTAARRFRLFDKFGPCYIGIGIEDLKQASSPAEIDRLWRQWILAEMATRIAMAIMQLELSIQVVARAHFQFLLPISTVTWYMPSSDALFIAPDASSWANLFIKDPPTKVNLSSLVYRFYRSDAVDMPLADATTLAAQNHALCIFHRYRVLCHIPPVGDHPDCFPPPWTEAIMAENRWRETCLMPSMTSPHRKFATFTNFEALYMIWHGRMLNLWINCDTLELVAGREGALRAFETLEQLGPNWSNTPQTRRAIIHAAQILKIALVNPTSNRCLALWDCSMIFRAAMVLFCYSIAFRGPSDPSSEIVTPIFTMTEEIDWNVVGLTGLPDQSSPILNPVQRFILSGGPCTLYPEDPLLTSELGRNQMLNLASDYLAKLGGSGQPIGSVFSSICKSFQLLGANF